HWLATMSTDALKRPYGLAHLTNPDALTMISSIAEWLSVAQIQAILGDVSHCRQQLLNVTGVNRELVLTDLILRTEHYLQPGTILPVPHL
ncbi:DNA polymerase III subunit delta' C-terminal domain-containing protein, partial [Salmonella enterica]